MPSPDYTKHTHDTHLVSSPSLLGLHQMTLDAGKTPEKRQDTCSSIAPPSPLIIGAATTPATRPNASASFPDISLLPLISVISPPSASDDHSQRSKRATPSSQCKPCGTPSSSKPSATTTATEGKKFKYVCPYEGCGKGFKTKGNLDRHKLVHTGEKPFQCLDCGKRFNRRDNMKQHRSTCKWVRGTLPETRAMPVQNDCKTQVAAVPRVPRTGYLTPPVTPANQSKETRFDASPSSLDLLATVSSDALDQLKAESAASHASSRRGRVLTGLGLAPIALPSAQGVLTSDPILEGPRTPSLHRGSMSMLHGTSKPAILVTQPDEQNSAQYQAKGKQPATAASLAGHCPWYDLRARDKS